MRKLSSNDMQLLRQHAEAIAGNPDLNMTTAQARHAIAVMWEFDDWASIEAAGVRGKGGETVGMTSPTSLLFRSKSKNTSPSAEVLRQVGNLVNYMAEFPLLTKEVGAVLPRLYGYTSMEQLTRLHPLTLVVSNEKTEPNEQQLYESLNGTPPGSKLYGGSNAAGFTLVSGAAEDNPLGFVLEQMTQSAANQRVRFITSPGPASKIRPNALQTSWDVLAPASLSQAVASAEQFLMQEKGGTVVFGLSGFPAEDNDSDVFQHLIRTAQSTPGAHLVFLAPELRLLPAQVWSGTYYKVLLQGALDLYPAKTNPLQLSFFEINQSISFTSRAQEDFSYAVKTGDAPARIVHAGTEELPEGYSFQECTG